MIHGVGEFDIKEKDNKIEDSFCPAGPEVESMPYLLLDLRDKDAFDQCHIIGGKLVWPLVNKNIYLSNECTIF